MKSFGRIIIINILLSPPSRRRGLKFLFIYTLYNTLNVASFAEAWIEICGMFNIKTPSVVASFAEAWIEIFCKQIYITINNCRLLRGGVD